MKKIIKYAGLLIALVSFGLMTWQRYSYPDMTNIRWFIDFWHVYLSGFAGIVAGCGLYLIGDRPKGKNL